MFNNLSHHTIMVNNLISIILFLLTSLTSAAQVTGKKPQKTCISFSGKQFSLETKNDLLLIDDKTFLSATRSYIINYFGQPTNKMNGGSFMYSFDNCSAGKGFYRMFVFEFRNDSAIAVKEWFK